MILPFLDKIDAAAVTRLQSADTAYLFKICEVRQATDIYCEFSLQKLTLEGGKSLEIEADYCGPFKKKQ